VPDQGSKHCASDMSQPSTVVESSISDASPIYRSASLASMCNDKSFSIHPKAQYCEELRCKVSAKESSSLRVSDRQISPHQNVSNSGSLFGHEKQGANSDPIPTGPKDSTPPRDNTLFGSASLEQQIREGEYEAGPEMFKVQRHGLADTDTVDDIAMADAGTDCVVSAGRLPSSEDQVLLKSTSRPSSSHSLQKCRDTNAKIQTEKDVLDYGDQFQQTLEPPVDHSYDNPQMTQIEANYNHKIGTQGYNASSGQQHRHLSKVAQAQQSLIKHNQEVEDILSHVERQKEVIQFLQLDLERLEAASAENLEKIQALQTEKSALKSKVKKFEQLSVKYQDHMNEVVISQKHLFKESQWIHRVQDDIKIFQEAYITREAHITRLESLLQEAREFRAPAEQLLTST
jgi:hypothetical protein